MIHIDHSLANPPPSPPQPAIPILASHLLELEEQQRKRFSRDGKSDRLSTGCREVDEVLGGGVERGIVLGISSAAEGREGRLLSLHLLASTLIPHLSHPAKPSTRLTPLPKIKATIIDTTGSFPLALLASVLRSRLLEACSLSIQNAVQTGNNAVQNPSRRSSTLRDHKSEKFVGVEEQVQRCLEMVAVSRVFDVEGLWEVIGEVENAGLASDLTVDVRNEKGDRNVTDGEVVTEQNVGEGTPEILDSEEETTPPIDIPPPISKEREDVKKDEGVEIIIVDNMTHIINELFARKEKSEAHILLTLLSSTLHTLSKTSNIRTILHNSTDPSTHTYPPNQNPNQIISHSHQIHLQTQAPIPTRSIFASAAQKPALGQIFAQFPDLHLLLHSLPKARRDAELLYGGHSDVFDDDSDQGGVRYVSAVEVVKDEAPSLEFEGGRNKFAYREQKWTAVGVDREGTRLVCAFEERGGMP